VRDLSSSYAGRLPGHPTSVQTPAGGGSPHGRKVPGQATCAEDAEALRRGCLCEALASCNGKAQYSYPQIVLPSHRTMNQYALLVSPIFVLLCMRARECPFARSIEARDLHCMMLATACPSVSSTIACTTQTIAPQ